MRGELDDGPWWRDCVSAVGTTVMVRLSTHGEKGCTVVQVMQPIRLGVVSGGPTTVIAEGLNGAVAEAKLQNWSSARQQSRRVGAVDGWSWGRRRGYTELRGGEPSRLQHRLDSTVAPERNREKRERWSVASCMVRRALAGRG
jgi:hypothetical protein